jgi:hypothetical protein
MAVVRPKFAAAQQKKRDVCIIGTGDGARLDLVEPESGDFLAVLTNCDGEAQHGCLQKIKHYKYDYDLGDLKFDSDGRCRQFLKPDVAAMEAELEQANAEVARLREENQELRSRGGDDEARMRWALGKMIAFAKKNGPSVDVYREGDVVLGCLGRIKTITEAAGLLLKDSKP